MPTLAEAEKEAVAVETVTLTYREAIAAAMADAMRADARVLLMGEDVAEAGGPFKTSEGLYAEFGASRVIDTPISENGFLTAALGMAVTGVRPIVEIMFSDFLPVAGDALVTEIPKFRHMGGGQSTVPLVVRAIGGGGGYFGSQHSATGESWLLQIPGLRIATASTPASAYGLLRTAIRLEDPVLFIEHKGLYTRKGEVARSGDALAPFGRAKVLRPGRDVTILATMMMVERALKAAETLAQEGIQVEVVDLQWLAPLDMDTVRESVERTGRLVIAEEQVHAGGWGATAISRLVMDGVSLKAPPRAVGMPDAPLSFSPPLEDAAIPTADRIAAATRAVCRAARQEERPA